MDSKEASELIAIIADNEIIAEHRKIKSLSMCVQGDPHCGKNYDEKCDKGCFEVMVDLQDLTQVKDEILKPVMVNRPVKFRLIKGGI